MKDAWRCLEEKEDEQYLAAVRNFDPEGCGLHIDCPTCKAEGWIKFPLRRYGFLPLLIACPAACGAYLPLRDFNPMKVLENVEKRFDMYQECARDGAKFALNGAIFRCPICGVENPREVMRALCESVEEGLSGMVGRQKIVEKLSVVVACFDGVMRRCNEIARKNYELMGLYPVENIRSFQNIVAAKEKLETGWDMSKIASDWDAVVRIFQKRHLFSHVLGVVDQDYIDKTGDAMAVVGRQVSLEAGEVVFLARELERIVDSFFGNYLS